MEQLLPTKLFIPSTRPDRVSRPHLIEKLNDGLCRKLTLISAPAGFGKTTLVGEWVDNLQEDDKKRGQTEYRIAWLSLDEGDNNLARFLSYLIAALQMLDNSIGQKAQTVFQSQQRLLVEPILMTLVNDITQVTSAPSEDLHKDLVLILDDYHVIEDPYIHQTIEYILEHQPPHFHLVILTRIDPPIPLPKLRARNQLVELRGINLHFSSEETAMFLNEIMKLDLAPDDITLLEGRTEGWIAGLQLVAISLQDQVNRQEFIQAFSGDDRFVIDFLLDEVLLRQPEDVRRFLLRSSVLDRMNGPLCDAVVNFSDEEPMLSGQGFLEYLDRANLFIVPLDNQRNWYRYHHLFSDVLQNRLRETELALIPELHLRASGWYENREDPDQAIQHTLAAGNLERAALLVEKNAIWLLAHSNLSLLKKWLESLPIDLIRSRPVLCVFQAWIHLLIGTVDDANQSINNAKRLLALASPQESIEKQEVFGHINVLESHIALKNGELQDAIELAEKSLNYIREGSPLHGHVAVIQGQVAYWNGALDAADQALIEAVSIAQGCDHLFMAVEATIWLGHIKTLQGRLHQAIEFYRDAIQLAELGEKHILPIAGSAYIGMALVEREWNNLTVAENLLMDSYEMCNLFGNTRSWHIAVALVKSAQGKKDEAHNEIQIAEKLESDSEVVFEHLNIEFERVRLWLSDVEGNLTKAARWAIDSGLGAEDIPSFSKRIMYTLYARVLIANGEGGKAHKLLVRLAEDARAGGRKGDLIEILTIQALSLQALDDTDQAVDTLNRALLLAESEGFIRTFVDEGPPMARLLYEALSREIAPAYVQRLLAVFPTDETEQQNSLQKNTHPSELVEPLSKRELEILQLIDHGLTNQEIATRLYISRHTVKAHTRNIYGKLGVNNRSQASAKARTMGVLSSD